MVMSEKKYTLKDLRLGMMAKAEQLSEIYNKLNFPSEITIPNA